MSCHKAQDPPPQALSLTLARSLYHPGSLSYENFLSPNQPFFCNGISKLLPYKEGERKEPVEERQGPPAGK